MHTRDDHWWGGELIKKKKMKKWKSKWLTLLSGGNILKVGANSHHVIPTLASPFSSSLFLESWHCSFSTGYSSKTESSPFPPNRDFSTSFSFPSPTTTLGHLGCYNQETQMGKMVLHFEPKQAFRISKLNWDPFDFMRAELNFWASSARFGKCH